MNSLIRAIISAMESDRRLLPASGIIILLAALLIWRAGHNYHVSAVEEMADRAEQYSALRSMLERADEFKALRKSYDERVMNLEKGLLGPDKPSTGAARLQEAFKALASKKNVSVTSQRVLNAIPEDRYIRVPVEFQVRAGMPQLKELLYDIQTSSILMGVKRLSVKAAESGAPGSLDVTMVVEGAIRKQAGVEG